MKNKVVVMAAKHIGKTTLVNMVLTNTKMKTSGYYTKMFKDKNNDNNHLYPVFIAPIGKEAIIDDEHCVSPIVDGIRRINIDAFEKYGVEYLNCNEKDTLIVMDEVGFLEWKAEKFKNKIFDVLKSENPVLITVKERDNIDYINKIKDYPGVKFYHMTLENRDSVFQEIKDLFCK